MEYFTLLHLQKEPFSNSPDPEMFFQSTQHQGCLQKLEIAIRLKRGLSVVIGDIGTGKSTLCRQLIQLITKGNTQILPYLILDPEFTTPLEFLHTIVKTIGLDCGAGESSEWQLKDNIKKYLFEQTIQQQKIPVLILDEGQKLPGFCVEILREFLNFETNQYKLLQIVIFAQKEFRAILKQKANFADRIATYQYLRPLSYRDTRAMIDFRLKKSHTESGPPPTLFSRSAILAIYCLTRGYPRRIVMLCSKVIIAILVTQNKQAGIFHVFRAACETAPRRPGSRNRKLVLTAILIVGVVSILFMGVDRKSEPIPTKLVPQEAPVATPPTPPQGEADPQAKQETPLATPPSPPPREEQPQPKQETPAPISVPTAETTQSAPIPPQPPSPPHPSSQSSSSPPAILGRVEVEKGVIISKMVARVYGRYSPPKLAMVLQANPHITTPDDVEVKTMVNFPVLPNTDLSIPANQVWLELAETTTLAEAYRIVKEYPESAPPLLIKPIVTVGNALVFHVILEETFNNENSALERARDLPPVWQGQARVKGTAMDR